MLVVEDDQKVANFIQSGLSQEGYAVDMLRDGTMAGEQARTVDYDAVVLDLMLPGRSGFQLRPDPPVEQRADRRRAALTCCRWAPLSCPWTAR